MGAKSVNLIKVESYQRYEWLARGKDENMWAKVHITVVRKE